MDPFSIAAAALSAVSSIAGGMQARKVGERNAKLLNEQADATRTAGYAREGLTRQRNAVTLSDQRGALSANGVDPTSGTALIGVAQSSQDAELDALTIRYEGLMQGRDQNMQADLAKYEGKAKQRQSYFSAASSLLQAGAGYMGRTQMPAPVETRIPVPNPNYRGPR